MKKVLMLSLVLLFLVSCKGQESMIEKVNETIKVSSKSECEQKGGYWYNDKCWANFKEFDDGIAIEDIDNEVAKQLAAVKDFGMTINEKPTNIDFFFPEMNFEDDELVMIFLFTEEKITKTMILTTSIQNLEKEKFEAETILFNTNLMELSEEDQANIPSYISGNGKATVKVTEKNDTQLFDIEGTLGITSNDTTIPFTIKAGETLTGIGNTTLEIKGNEVFLNGTLGTKTYQQFKDLIANHPEVTTIVLQNVPGSINDAVNMHTGRIVRAAGLTTKVLADSQISSGGVDLFCAGKERIIHKGAQLGIHSWGGEGISADDVAKDHPAHQYQITYFTMCLGKENGPNFYFRTLEAAPAGDMHWMSDEEIKAWKLATTFIEE